VLFSYFLNQLEVSNRETDNQNEMRALASNKRA